MSSISKNQRTEIGTVLSSKCDKTITVLVERRVRHPVYGKYIRKSTKLHAHDAANSCSEGDVVRVKESRPHSKTKTWDLVEIVQKA